MKRVKILQAGDGDEHELDYTIFRHSKLLAPSHFEINYVLPRDARMFARDNSFPSGAIIWDRKKLALLRLMRKYDLIHAYASFGIYAMLSGKPYVLFLLGSDLRELAFEKTIKGYLMRRAIARANKVVYNNMDMQIYLIKLGIFDAELQPQIVDLKKYSEVQTTKIYDGAPLIFHPTRLNWAQKGNDRLIYAFSKYIKTVNSARLIITMWGEDQAKTLDLIETLNLNDKVYTLPLQTKSEMISLYRSADVVVDQFIVDAFAGVTLEAMGCETRVITNLNIDLAKKAYTELPPILPAKTADDILSALIECGDKNSGSDCRGWVKRHHSPRVLMKKLFKFYDEVLNEINCKNN